MSACNAGSRIREMRTYRSKTAVEVCRAAGCGQRTLREIELGVTVPKLATLIPILQYVNQPIDDIFTPEFRYPKENIPGKTFGERLKHVMAIRGFINKDLDKKLGSPGLATAWRNDEIYPSLPLFEKMCRMLEVNPSELVK